MSKLLGGKEAASGVVLIDAPHRVKTHDAVYARLGWLIVLAGVGGFLLWASFAPLDQGVPISGTIMVAGNRKAIQDQPGGIVDAILVRDGDKVKVGQVLVRMNDVQIKAQAEITRAQLFSDLAVEARLVAERDGKTAVVFPPRLLSAEGDPRVSDVISMQKQLFFSRQSAIQHELAALDENSAGLNDQLQGLEASRENKQQQLQYLKEQLDGMRDLVKGGFVARNRLLELERNYVQLNGAIAEDTGNIGHIKSEIAELKLRHIQRQQEYQKEVRQQLADVQREANALDDRLAAQDFDLANTLVKSPVDGTVVGMNVFTNGGVIGAGMRMMDVVPSEDALIIEGRVPVNLIDKVHVGLKVDMIFSAFNQNTTPHVPGIVTEVSADRITDERTGQPYYTLKAKVAPEGVKLLAKLRLRPGMPVEAFVSTGQRTMMSYLLKPVFDRIKTSMSEE